MELISTALRLEFREFCAGLFLRQIDGVFEMAGIHPGAIPSNRNTSGERRTRVEEYYASMNWTIPEDAHKFLRVLELVLSQSYIPEDGKDFIRELCISSLDKTGRSSRLS